MITRFEAGRGAGDSRTKIRLGHDVVVGAFTVKINRTKRGPKARMPEAKGNGCGNQQNDGKQNHSRFANRIIRIHEGFRKSILFSNVNQNERAGNHCLPVRKAQLKSSSLPEIGIELMEEWLQVLLRRSLLRKTP
jgi:hypothetical protein